MNDIAKLLSGIGDTLAGNTANPFEAETFTNATRHIDNINELKDLSNDDDSFTNEQLKDEFNNLLTEFLTDENGENPFYVWGQDRMWLIQEEIAKRSS